MADLRREILIEARFDIKQGSAPQETDKVFRSVDRLDKSIRALEQRLATLGTRMGRQIAAGAEQAARGLDRMAAAAQAAAASLAQASSVAGFGGAGIPTAFGTRVGLGGAIGGLATPLTREFAGGGSPGQLAAVGAGLSPATQARYRGGGFFVGGLSGRRTGIDRFAIPAARRLAQFGRFARSGNLFTLPGEAAFRRLATRSPTILGGVGRAFGAGSGAALAADQGLSTGIRAAAGLYAVGQGLDLAGAFGLGPAAGIGLAGGAAILGGYYVTQVRPAQQAAAAAQAAFARQLRGTNRTAFAEGEERAIFASPEFRAGAIARQSALQQQILDSRFAAANQLGLLGLENAGLTTGATDRIGNFAAISRQQAESIRGLIGRRAGALGRDRLLGYFGTFDQAFTGADTSARRDALRARAAQLGDQATSLLGLRAQAIAQGFGEAGALNLSRQQALGGIRGVFDALTPSQRSGVGRGEVDLRRLLGEQGSAGLDRALRTLGVRLEDVDQRREREELGAKLGAEEERLAEERNRLLKENNEVLSELIRGMQREEERDLESAAADETNTILKDIRDLLEQAYESLRNGSTTTQSRSVQAPAPGDTFLGGSGP